MKLNPFSSDKDKPVLSEAQKSRKLLRELIIKGIFTVMVAIAIVYAVISALLGSSLFIPRDAAGVLDSVKEPAAYTWSSESVRQVEFGEELQEQHAARSATVDLGRDKFQAEAVGPLPERAFYASDGKLTVTLDEAALTGGSGEPQMITDYCNDAPPISAQTLAMPSAEMISAAHPELVTDEATAFGVQAWEIGFELSPEIIKQLMWVDFYEEAADEDFNWVVSEKELTAIEAGEFEADYATAWVTRNERELVQIDTRFTINDGSSYRFMAQIVPQAVADPLAETDLDPTGELCSVQEQTTGESSGEQPAADEPTAATPAPEPETTTPETTTPVEEESTTTTPEQTSPGTDEPFLPTAP